MSSIDYDALLRDLNVQRERLEAARRVKEAADRAEREQKEREEKEAAERAKAAAAVKRRLSTTRVVIAGPSTMHDDDEELVEVDRVCDNCMRRGQKCSWPAGFGRICGVCQLRKVACTVGGKSVSGYRPKRLQVSGDEAEEGLKKKRKGLPPKPEVVVGEVLRKRQFLFDDPEDISLYCTEAERCIVEQLRVVADGIQAEVGEQRRIRRAMVELSKVVERGFARLEESLAKAINPEDLEYLRRLRKDNEMGMVKDESQESDSAVVEKPGESAGAEEDALKE